MRMQGILLPEASHKMRVYVCPWKKRKVELR